MLVKLLLLRTDLEVDNIQAIDPPLGLLSLSAVIKRDLHGKVDVQIKDMRLRGQNKESLTNFLLEWQPDIIGISAFSAEAIRTKYWIDLARKLLPKSKILVGGPYASSEREECLQQTGADVVFLDEAETSLSAWLNCDIEGKSADNVSGLILWDEDRKPFYTPDRKNLEDINALPIPDWNAIDIKEYHYGLSINVFEAHNRYAPIMTSRGCPYKCTYCHNFFGKTVRFRDLSLVLEEISMLYHKLGIREIQIVDDIFNINRKRVIEFCDRIKKTGMKLYFCFPNGLRGDLLTEDVIDALVEVGAYSITFAIETASPRIQKLIQKNLDLEKTAKMVRYTDSKGIIPKAFFMLGFLTETREEMQQTIDMAIKLPFLQANFFTVVPQKNTALYDMAKKEDPDFSKNEIPMYWGQNPNYAKKMGYDLPKIQYDAMKRFYLTPYKTFKLFWRLPGKLMFIKNFTWCVFFRLMRNWHLHKIAL